jgi:hypothetical protein
MQSSTRTPPIATIDELVPPYPVELARRMGNPARLNDAIKIGLGKLDGLPVGRASRIRPCRSQ